MSRQATEPENAHDSSTRQRKRRSDGADDGLRMRPASPSCSNVPLPAAASTVSRSLLNPIELRAFGLEDRAEAVISMGASTSWSLNNLAQWRQEMAQPPPSMTPGAARPTQQHQQSIGDRRNHSDYIEQRQRQYKQQMLRARAPTQ